MIRWTNKDLPRWSECKEDSNSALFRFIYENEPASTKESNIFRNGLLEILNEEKYDRFK